MFANDDDRWMELEQTKMFSAKNVLLSWVDWLCCYRVPFCASSEINPSLAPWKFEFAASYRWRYSFISDVIHYLFDIIFNLYSLQMNRLHSIKESKRKCSRCVHRVRSQLYSGYNRYEKLIKWKANPFTRRSFHLLWVLCLLCVQHPNIQRTAILLLLLIWVERLEIVKIQPFRKILMLLVLGCIFNIISSSNFHIST